MPLIIIHSLPPSDPEVVSQMLTEVRDSGARAFDCSPNNIWVMFNAIPVGSYVQGLVPASAPCATSHPPCVIIRVQSGRGPREREALVKATATVIGQRLSVPADNVWIHSQEMRPEDVWFQGRWSR